MPQKNSFLIWLFLLAISVAIVGIIILGPQKTPQPFEGARAYQDVNTQVGFGPRTPGSEAHASTVEYLVNELTAAGWQVEIQETESMGHPIRNIVAKRGWGLDWVILGAHYDTRMVADQDPFLSNQSLPVYGANDGASGVAVLLEIARVLPKSFGTRTWLVFFDAEDQGRIPGWDWILGSRAFVASLSGKPDAVVVVDMIGDADLNIYREQASDPALTSAIWQTAQDLGYQDTFIDETKYNILDDHVPFLETGIPAVDLIDFDYSYWHTLADTPDKVSPKSLEIVGNTLLTWMAWR